MEDVLLNDCVLQAVHNQHHPLQIIFDQQVDNTGQISGSEANGGS